MSARMMCSHVWSFALLAGIFCAGPAPAALIDDAIAEVSATAASDLASRSDRFKKLAVMPFANDRGDRLASAVTSAIVSQDWPGAKVLDRDAESFRTVIEELKRTGSDLYNTEDAPQFGRRLVADAVLIGRVNEWRASSCEAALTVEMKVVSTETGEIVWSNNRITSHKVCKWITVSTIIWVAIVVFVVGTFVLYRYRRARVRTIMTGRQVDSRLGKALGKGVSDEDIRAGISRALQNAKSQLSAARAAVEKNKDVNMLRAVRDVENDMDLLRKRAEIAASGRPETMSVGQAKATFRLDEQTLEGARAIEGFCQAVAEAALAGNADTVAVQAKELKLAIHRLRTTFDERGDKFAGV